MAHEINGELREKLGSRSARKLRAQDRIPCSLQSAETASLAFSIDEADFLSARRHHEHLFDVKIGKDKHPAVVRELQWDYLSDRIIHCEFQAVVLGVEIENDVTLDFVGIPKGGVLNVLLDSITISSIPSMIPDTIAVPVGELVDGDHLEAGQIEMPEGCTLVTAADYQVAIVSGAGGGEAPEEEEGDEAADSVEVIGETPEEE
jgi:large subunit ribosomal protein L25